MLRLIPTTETPPDKLRFKFSDGHVVHAFGQQEWWDKIRTYATDNNYPVPSVEEAENQLCQLLPPGWCQHEDGRTPEWYVDTRMGLDTVIAGTKVLIEFVKQGAPLVDQATAESRAATCAACFMNIEAGGCGTCRGLASLVEEVAGQRTTKADALLANKSCAVCKCVSRANIWLPVEVSKAGVAEEQLKMFPDFCWKKQGILALQ